MMYVNSVHAGRLVRSAVVVLLGAAVMACGTPHGRAVPVHETTPSVTYEFSGDQGLIDATLQAETYCRQFNSWPAKGDVRTDGRGGSAVTFVCDQPRTVAFAGAQAPPIPSNPTVHYTFYDERSLVEATTQAQRYCAGFGAHARSSTITTGPGANRTVMFECVR